MNELSEIFLKIALIAYGFACGLFILVFPLSLDHILLSIALGVSFLFTIIGLVGGLICLTFDPDRNDPRIPLLAHAILKDEETTEKEMEVAKNYFLKISDGDEKKTEKKSIYLKVNLKILI